MKKKMSRLESNKSIRQALVKNSVDLSKISFSCHGRSVTLSGTLMKNSGQEFTTQGVEAIVLDIEKVGPSINSDLTNWEISESGIKKKDLAQKKKENGPSDGHPHHNNSASSKKAA